MPDKYYLWKSPEGQIYDVKYFDNVQNDYTVEILQRYQSALGDDDPIRDTGPEADLYSAGQQIECHWINLASH